MIFSLLSPDEWVSLLTPMAVGVSIVYQRMNSKKVKTALQEATVKSNNKLNVIHGLVNGSMAEQKRVVMMQAKRIAELTNSPADHALALNAERSYIEQQKRQDALLALELPLEHRTLMTDGPAVRMILQRLENIENRLTNLKCNGEECQKDPPTERTSRAMPAGEIDDQQLTK